MAQFQIAPFTAARIARLPHDDARRELTALGIRHLKQQKAMRWDGSDPRRGYRIAVEAMNLRLDSIAARTAAAVRAA